MVRTPRHAISGSPRDCGLPVPNCRTRSSHRFIRFAALVAAWGVGLSWFAEESYSAPRRKPSADAELVKDLTARLSDSRSVIRREAVVRLAQLGPAAGDALSGLKRCLEDDDPYVRAHAARATFRIGHSPEPAVRVLIELLQPDDPQLCCLASLILGEIGPEAHAALATLQTCMKAPDTSVRLHAAEACLRIDAYHVPAMQELLSAMDDDKSDIRYFAANALGNAAIGDPQALLALHWALTDVDTNVAITASLNLSKRFDLAGAAIPNDPALSPEEITQLIEKLRDPSETVRQTAAIKLGLAGPAARIAGTALRECLSDADLIVRLHVAHALWQIEHQAGEIVPELIDMLGTTEPNVSIAAISVLGEIGPAADEALPSLLDMFTGSRLRERLHLACMISRIDGRDREMIGIVTAGLMDNAGDVRYLAALALGCSPVGHQRRVERVLQTAAEDRNLRVQAAATEATDRLRARITVSRNALSAQYSSRFGKFDATDPIEAPPIEESSSSRVVATHWVSSETPATELLENSHQRSGQAGSDATVTDPEPSIAEVANSIGPDNPATADDEQVDPEEGLKPIRKVGASIKTGTGPLPPDYAAAKMAAEGPPQFQGLGSTRGFVPIGFGWDAPAVCYKPLYFEDINLERYGINYGFLEILTSTGRFSKNVLLLPYKLMVQPGSERIYTLGYERPNNCIPLHCFHTPLPDLSLRRWIDRCSYRPYRHAPPWTPPEGVCDGDDGDADCSEE